MAFYIVNFIFERTVWVFGNFLCPGPYIVELPSCNDVSYSDSRFIENS